MALISIENMRFRAFHGLYEEEQILGSDFLVDVWIDVDIDDAAIVNEHEMDKLTNTVNYQTVYDIVKIVMREREKLLESVVNKLLLHLKYQFDNMNECRIRLRKLNPPIDGVAEFSSILEIKHFLRECPKCSDDMTCYKDGTCWCMEAKSRMHPRALEMIGQQFKNGCICPMCLSQFRG